MSRQNLDISRTIFARVTGTLPCAVAIVKLSGKEAFSIATRLFIDKSGLPLRSPCAGRWFGTLLDPSGKKLDDILLVSFVGPRSHSGEDTVEFHCHGSVAVIRSLEQSFLDCGARPAERGEFSYRAFLNGKTTAESLEDLADVFVAKRGQDLARIYDRKDSALERQIAEIRHQVVGLQALLDTAVDFSEEYSFVSSLISDPLSAAIRDCSAIIQRYSAFREPGNCPRLVLAGRPNAGKSSLFNAILCRYRAIVHEEPGTTRDVIEENLEILGASWKLVDTAGVRTGMAGAEQIGIEMGSDFLSASSFWLLVIDGRVGLEREDSLLLEKFGNIPHLVLWNKTDALECKTPPHHLKALLTVSALTGKNVDSVWKELTKVLPTLYQEDTPLPRATQIVKLKSVVKAMAELESEWRSGVPAEFLAESNRQILNELQDLVGLVDAEVVLDRVFNDFCIGK